MWSEFFFSCVFSCVCARRRSAQFWEIKSKFFWEMNEMNLCTWKRIGARKKWHITPILILGQFTPIPVSVALSGAIFFQSNSLNWFVDRFADLSGYSSLSYFPDSAAQFWFWSRADGVWSDIRKKNNRSFSPSLSQTNLRWIIWNIDCLKGAVYFSFYFCKINFIFFRNLGLDYPFLFSWTFCCFSLWYIFVLSHSRLLNLSVFKLKIF